jgi:hypothetical protein
VLLEIGYPVALVNRPFWRVGNTSFYLPGNILTSGFTHTNHILLCLLLQDQQLIPRLRSLENYFFLASLSVAHLLDLSYTELKKPAKGVSIVKL